MKSILIIAGGTGGHIFPALTVADKLARMNVTVNWLGSHVGMEKDLVAPHYPLHYIEVQGVRGHSLMRKIKAPFVVLKAIYQSWKIIRQLKPDMVMGMGGFASGPGCIAAWMLKLPVLVHEQNAVAGYTNKILTRFTKQVYAAFPNAFQQNVEVRVVGNPLRRDIINLPKPQARYTEQHERLHVLVLGGSLGARPINTAVAEWFQTLADKASIAVWHQCGKLDLEQMRTVYHDHHGEVKLQAFIEDIDAAYAWADIIVCRSGALTVSEIAAIGVAAIFIPMPHAVDNHQYFNARYLTDDKAAILLPQTELSAEKLQHLIQPFVDDKKSLLTMAEQARKKGKPAATQAIANACLKIIENRTSLLANKNIKRIHCIGIGGIGVSGLAEILLKHGYQVSGSDPMQTPITKRLQELGITVYHDHAGRNIEGVDAVVFSSAIQKNNPEMQAALNTGIPILRRGQLLAELMRHNTGIAVAGTHGKTTTTSLLFYVLLEGGLNPTGVIGGILNNMKSPIHVGGLEYFVAEADESDASFLHMHPKIAIITNIEPDHMETYDNDFASLKQSFVDFLTGIPNDGIAVLCIDDPEVRALMPRISCKTLTYGFAQDADVRINDYSQQGLVSKVTVFAKGMPSQTLTINLPGKHNVLNAVAAVAVAKHLGVSFEKVIKALQQFPGVGRRFYAHGEYPVNGGAALLFDDYGHHPTEVKATFEAAKQAWPDRRIVMVFQPHRYTRTRDLMREFVEVLSATDHLILCDVYSAGEAVIPGADGESLYNAIVQMDKVQPTFVSSLDDLPGVLQTVLQPDDIVLFQGAGSIGPLAAKLVAEPI